MLYRQLLAKIVVIGYGKAYECGYGAQVESALLGIVGIAQLERREVYGAQRGKSLAKPHDALAIAAQHHFVARCEIVADKWDTASSMTQSPVERCNQNFHALTMTSMPLARSGAAIASISALGTLDNVCSGVARSMT